jgi:hypothetical protein
MIKAKFVIADVPAVPVTTVDLKTDKSGEEAPAASPETAGKKFIWGTPAGSADVKTDTPDNEIPPRPEPRKYQWGLK